MSGKHPPIDEGKRIIRIDTFTRKNGRIRIGNKVIVRKIIPKVAKRVIMAPAIPQGGRVQFGHGIEDIVKQGLLKRPICAGEIIVIPGISLYGNLFPFGVIKTKPKEIVTVGEETVVVINEEAIKEGIVNEALDFDDTKEWKVKVQRRISYA